MPEVLNPLPAATVLDIGYPTQTQSARPVFVETAPVGREVTVEDFDWDKLSATQKDQYSMIAAALVQESETQISPQDLQTQTIATFVAGQNAIAETPTGNPATGATAGTPGSFTPSGSTAPANLAGLSSVVASPSTAWTAGQHVVLGDSSHSYWNGSVWTAGDSVSAFTTPDIKFGKKE